MSKERAVLQERYTALEESLKSSKNALAQSEAEKERMELAMKDLTGQWQEEVQRKEEVQEQVAALDQQLKVIIVALFSPSEQTFVKRALKI